MENVDLEKRMAEFRIRLKKHGLKVTQQRYAVHEAMLKLGHASADMVTEEIVKEGKTKVTVASVYNILINHVYIDIYDDLLYKSIADKLLSKRFKGYKVDGMDIQILAHPTSRMRK